MLERKALDSLHECYGTFLLDAPVQNVAGLGEGTAEKLIEVGVLRVGELYQNLNKARPLLSRRQIAALRDYAGVLKEHGVGYDLEEQPRLF